MAQIPKEIYNRTNQGSEVTLVGVNLINFFATNSTVGFVKFFP